MPVQGTQLDLVKDQNQDLQGHGPQAHHHDLIKAKSSRAAAQDRGRDQGGQTQQRPGEKSGQLFQGQQDPAQGEVRLRALQRQVIEIATGGQVGIDLQGLAVQDALQIGNLGGRQFFPQIIVPHILQGQTPMP